MLGEFYLRSKELYTLLQFIHAAATTMAATAEAASYLTVRLALDVPTSNQQQANSSSAHNCC